MNPAIWLDRTARAQSDAPALCRGTRVLRTYRDFARAAAGMASALRARGIARGDRVAVFARNAPDYLVALYGIWWAGAVAVPINAKLHVAEAAWILDNSDTSLAFVDPGTTDPLRDRMTSPPALVDLGGAEFARMTSAEPEGPPAAKARDDLSWLFYTSGTTGRPKGVMITCGNLAAMTLEYFVDVDNVQPRDAALYAAPMSHGAGLYNFMHVIRGARHVIPESGGFDAAEILDLAPRVGPVSMFAAPTMVRRLVDAARGRDAPGDGLRTIVYAGGPMYLADILDAVAVMGPHFVQIYGQGECPMAITALPRADVADRDHPRWRARLASVGRAQSVVELAVVAPDGTPLPHGTPGEVCVRGAPVMRGYWRNESASAEALKDGWLHTGDIGHLDADGYLTLQDRARDLIISGGSNIYPREVEEVLLQHPDVAEAAVVGRPHHDWGEEVVACLVLSPGAQLDPGALDALCTAQIARFKRPKSYRVLGELPKNNYGKVLKNTLREIVAS